jgi:hypothetical protein
MNDQNQGGLAKDPQDWKSGDDPATPAQESYLHTLADQAGEDVPDGLTKAAASEKIDDLRARAGLENQGTSSARVGLGIGDPVPTDEELEGDGNGDRPARNTPISPNANR